MNVLVVLGWAGGYGGVENVVRKFTRFMSGRGHKITIIVDKTGVESTEWLRGIEWELTDLGINRHCRHWKFRRIIVLTRLMLKYRPDIVLVDIPYWIPYIRYACNVLRVAGLRSLVGSWIHSHIDHTDKYLMKWLGNANCHFAISKSNAETLCSISSREKVKVVYNPVHLPDTFVPRSTLGHENFVFIGRLAPEKRVDVVLRALSTIRDFPWKLTVVGDGPMKEELYQLQRELLLPSDQILWRGWRMDPWEVIQDATALVLPSPREGLPLVAIESLARGIPIIVSDGQISIQDLVLNGGGWSFSTNDENSLAGTLRGILGGRVNVPDQSELRKISSPFEEGAWGVRFERYVEETTQSLMQKRYGKMRHNSGGDHREDRPSNL